MPRLTEAEANDLAVKALMAMAVDEYKAELRAEIEVLPGNDPFQSPERRDAYEYAINDVLDLIDGSSDD
jgi:hypothetical protein